MKTALITGIGRGIGKAIAQKFLTEGWQVIGTSTSGSVDFTHERLSVFQLDLASSESIETFAHKVGRTDKVNVYINNAGVLLDDEETVLVPEKLRETLEVNVIGTAALTERMLTYMAPEGHILFISSTAGSLERTGHLESHWPNHYPAYKISKAALNMYMRTLAQRLKDGNMIVSSVHPGWVRTEMGGDEATMMPEEAAQDIYRFAISTPETGNFWYKGQQMPW